MRTDAKEIVLRRAVDMASEGWWSGELHVHRPMKDIELLMQAEDLHVAPVITWWNQRNEWTDKPLPMEPLVRFDEDRFYHLLAGEDEREGGALLFFNLRQPLAIATKNREHPSPMKFLKQAKAAGGWIDIEKPFWWDVPIWLASGQVDSIGLANNHMQRSKMYGDGSLGQAARCGATAAAAGQRPLDAGDLLPRAELRTAHSALGRQRQRRAAQPGRLQPRVRLRRRRFHLRALVGGTEGRPRDGHQRPAAAALRRRQARRAMFSRRPAGREVVLDAVSNLATRDKVTAIEVIENGRVKHSLRIEDLVKQNGEVAGAGVQGKRLVLDSCPDRQREDLSLRFHRTVLRPDRRPAAHQPHERSLLP